MRWSLSIVGLPAPWAAPLSAAIRNRFTEGFISSIWTYGAIIAAAHAIIYYTAVRERDINEARLREKLAQHQFQILKLRLHPHFLFNTLNAISALVVTDISAARTALADLSDMLRMTLNHSEHELISVRDEMNFVSSYLSLQKMRFSDRLTVAIDVDPGVLRARVPNMILQPLVENAIRHGIERLNAPGIVALRVWPRGSSLVMEVNNPTAGSRNIHGWGIGLSSVRTRLAALYGEDQSLEICKSEDSQIRVTVVIPLHWPVALEDVHSAATFAL
jgi:LytS/YehU family sensor histidine kinase